MTYKQYRKLEAELLVANAMASSLVNADARAWAKAEVSRIEAKIYAIKEQDK
tara:strand:- start:332 stop:487 length:156 start_codon:yes stop_codon:yes gene_type:complete